MPASLLALIIALLASSYPHPTTAWKPMKGTFDIPFSTFPDAHCGAPLNNQGLPIDGNHTVPMTSSYAALRDGICMRQGSAFTIGSFAYGHENHRDSSREKGYPICTVEIYAHEFCGGEARDFGPGAKSAGSLPGLPIYAVDTALRQDHLRECQSLGARVGKGRSALMTCKFVHDNELPRCADKRVKDDAGKGLLRACYSYELNSAEGSSDREAWCKPHCGNGWPKPVHQPGFGPQCKSDGGNCHIN